MFVWYKGACFVVYCGIDGNSRTRGLLILRRHHTDKCETASCSTANNKLQSTTGGNKPSKSKRRSKYCPTAARQHSAAFVRTGKAIDIHKRCSVISEDHIMGICFACAMARFHSLSESSGMVIALATLWHPKPPRHCVSIR